MIKVALRRYQADLVSWLVGERPLAVRAVDPSLSVAAERFADKIIEAEFAHRAPMLLHVEFQSAGDKDMSERMALYFTLLLLAMKPHASGRQKEERKREHASVVVYLDEETYRKDPGSLTISGALGLKFSFEYAVVRLWERDPGEILELESPGLCPFVPLMRGNPVELVLKSQERIMSAPEDVAPNETKRELLLVLGALAGRVIKDRAYLAKLFSEIRLMGDNPFIDLIREEGEIVGLEKGREEGVRVARRGIACILQARFGSPTDAVMERVEQVENLAILETLLERAAVCQSINDFLGVVSQASEGAP